MIQNNQEFPFCKFRIPQGSGRVIWEITNECNYGCKYCIFASTGRKPERELSKEQIFNALQELKQHNFSHIKFTGGEPFLREDMVEILKEATSLGMECDISTNASKMTDGIAQELKKLHLEFIHVSMDGHDQSTHELVRGKKSFLPTENGIKTLLNHGLKVRIGCVIHVGNQNLLSDMAEYCIQLGVSELVFSLMEPAGRLRGKTTYLATLSTTELANSLTSIIKSYPQLKISHNLASLQTMTSPLSYMETIPVNQKSYCPAGKQFLFIDSLGNVSPCTWVSENRPQYIAGKISENTLSDILNSKPINDMRHIADNLPNFCPMTNLESTAAIERATKAAQSYTFPGNPKFGTYAPIYPFTTENLDYLHLLEPITGKKVLTVGGSYDHAITLYSLGANTVENIDINLCAKYYGELKNLALKQLSFTDFINFFSNFTLNTYEVLKSHLTLETQTFFTTLLSLFNNNGRLMRNSPVFHNLNAYSPNANPHYLKNQEHYNLAKKNQHHFLWHTQSIEQPFGSFNLILLSNIADYSHKMYPFDNHLELFKNNVVLPWLEHLNERGDKIMFAYVFDSHNTNGSDIRNPFNLKEMRQYYYGNIPGYQYEEKAVLENELICILTKI